jgi:hypothetical protein
MHGPYLYKFGAYGGSCSDFEFAWTRLGFCNSRLKTSAQANSLYHKDSERGKWPRTLEPEGASMCREYGDQKSKSKYRSTVTQKVARRRGSRPRIRTTVHRSLLP